MEKPMKQTFIAEIKTRSPFGFKSNYDSYSLQMMAMEHGDMISIHVDPLWGGNVGYIGYMKKQLRDNRIHKPLIAKGLHLSDQSIEESIKYGADYVTVVGRIPTSKYLLPKCILEPLPDYGLPYQDFVHSTLDKMIETEPYGIIFNSRNLFDGSLNYWDYESLKLRISDISKNINLIQASGIKSMSTVHPLFNSYIVGENLPRFILNKQLTELRRAEYHGG